MHLLLACRFKIDISLSITTPQEAHKRLVLKVYLGLNTLEFSAIKKVKALLVEQISLRFCCFQY